MLRTMVFIDQLNFALTLSNYTGSLGLPNLRLDYTKVPKVISSYITNSVLTKTLLFAPKPDTFLMQDPFYEKHYSWLKGLNTQQYFDVVEGEYVARPTSIGVPMDILDKSTYYKEEKGTDINVAVEAITKAFNNAYDVALFMSADTDYIPVYKTLRTIGKLVVVAVIKGQSIGKLLPHIDSHIFIDLEMLNDALRP